MASRLVVRPLKVRLLGASFLLVMMGGALFAQSPGTLARLAASAKSAGRTTASFDVMFDDAGEGSVPDEVLKFFSLVVARPLDLKRVTTADQDHITTWSAVRVIRSVSFHLKGPGDCPHVEAPRDLVLTGPDVFALSTPGGTYMVDGVAVTQTGYSPEARLESGRDYLLLVTACPGSVLSLPYAGKSVFEVGPGGRLSVAHGLRRPFIDMIVGLGTVDAVEKYVRSR